MLVYAKFFGMHQSEGIVLRKQQHSLNLRPCYNILFLGYTFDYKKLKGAPMIGLLISVIIFNYLAFKLNKKLNKNQTLHIYIFTIAFQSIFDIFIDIKFRGYWYFSQAVDWGSLVYLLFLVSPVNIIFLNFYPLEKSLYKKIITIILWDVLFIAYEFITLLPKPWGYFHYGWWKWQYSFLLNPLLLFILIKYYRLVMRFEKTAKNPSP